MAMLPRTKSVVEEAKIASNRSWPIVFVRGRAQEQRRAAEMAMLLVVDQVDKVDPGGTEAERGPGGPTG